MQRQLQIYNSVSRKKESFAPLVNGAVGMYVCGPTVYSDVHLGNCRTFLSFDIVYRYLKQIGYKVRYVRNITDVGHLEGDADVGAEDKISKKARLEQLEPMEIVQKYTLSFHDVMRQLNLLPPDIEPRASGHIIEQIEMVKQILDNGLAYEVNGSVYFDTPKFIQETELYGKLSGRVTDELLTETRDLKHQDEKRNPADFALWIKADPNHLMRWPSPWSEGFPGWHLECSAMSTKYLGKQFDIHGGGNDLKFPHHENEIAQNYGACSCAPAKYWMHGNMLLMNGKKMSKSDGNTITPAQLFSGDSPHISKAYSPEVVRFFMLQTHYRSTLDLTDEALQAAEKGYYRLMEGWKLLGEMESPIKSEGELDIELREKMEQAYAEMDDDFNTPKALARIFEIVPRINAMYAGQIDNRSISAIVISELRTFFKTFLFDIFGLRETEDQSENGHLDDIMQLVIEIREQARKNKDWGTADLIRDRLKESGVVLKDDKEGTRWTFE